LLVRVHFAASSKLKTRRQHGVRAPMYSQNADVGLTRSEAGATDVVGSMGGAYSTVGALTNSESLGLIVAPSGNVELLPVVKGIRYYCRMD
ncbi:MAG TPA: hypothetical protein VGO93_04735, partial [Candidatus Xenobia bacterium]